MTDYALVLTREYPGREWSLNGDTYDGLTFHDDGPVPSQADLDGLWPSVRDARAWDAIRVERDALLTASDWTVLPDAPLTTAQKTAWKTYRQTLRDLPQTFATPDGIVWPEQP